MSQPRRVRFVGGVPFAVIEDDRPTRTGDAVDFDGGAREPLPEPPRIVWTRCEDDRAWLSAEFPDRKW